MTATADYLEASASAHWFLRWTGEPPCAQPAADLPMTTLQVTCLEEAEEDPTMRAVIVDTALQAAAAELTRRVVELELHDA